MANVQQDDGLGCDGCDQSPVIVLQVEARWSLSYLIKWREGDAGAK